MSVSAPFGTELLHIHKIYSSHSGKNFYLRSPFNMCAVIEVRAETCEIKVLLGSAWTGNLA